MNPRALFALMRADYLERVRTHAFLVTLGLTLYFTYMAMPTNPSRYATFEIAGRRGLYDSAWVGCLVALMTGAFLSLAGFYVVKNAIERDRRTGVGSILAATPLSKPLYVLGKWASNWAVLGTIAATVAVGAIGMQLLRGEERHVDLLAIAAPFVALTMPGLAVIAALAVLFEATPWLRGGFGNAVYFFLWGPMLAGSSMADPTATGGIGDLTGVSAVVPGIRRGLLAAHPELVGTKLGFNLGFNIKEGLWNLETFRWSGMEWTAELLWPRLTWALIGCGIALLAAIPFDRFDTARAGGGRARFAGRSPSARPGEARGSAAVLRRPLAGRALAALAGLVPPWPFARLVFAELRLMVGGMPLAWHPVAAGLAIACWFAPLAVARLWLLPFAWIWPLLAWSGMGARESRWQTSALVFSSAGGLRRQLAAAWVAGVVVSVAMGAGVGARLLAGGAVEPWLVWMAGALFVPSLALACGVWTASGKLFEVLYLILWYVGPMNRVPRLDFMGIIDAPARAANAAGFAAAALVLLGLASLGRRRAVR